LWVIIAPKRWCKNKPKYRNKQNRSKQYRSKQYRSKQYREFAITQNKLGQSLRFDWPAMSRKVFLMTNHARYPSYVNCVARVLSNSAQPISVDTLIAHIEHQRPITKGARRAVYRAIGQLFQAVPVTTSHYGWLSCLLRHNLFRHPLTNDEARKGYLLLDELEHAVFFSAIFPDQ